MSISIINSYFEEIGKDKFNRSNYKTAVLLHDLSNFQYAETIRLKELFNVISGFAFKSEDYVSEGVALVRIGDLNDYMLSSDNMVCLPDEYYDEPKYKNYRIQKNDLLISLTGDGNLKCLKATDDSKYLLNQRVAILRAKKELNIDFYYWLINSDYVKKQFTYYSNGKSQLNISPFDLMNIKVPVLDDTVQFQFVEKITPIYQNIIKKANEIENATKIINTVFIDYFDYDFDKFNHLKGHKIFQSDFASYGNNVDTRFSVKFHRPAGEFVYSELEKSDYYKLKNVVYVPMITGQGISNEYDDNGTCSYVSMADISTWELDLKSLKTVSSEYEKKNSTKKIKGITEPQSTKLLVNDIVMMRSGEGGIGKVALIKDEIDAIFCDFLIRIRFDETVINPQFAYYYFRTTYFQYLIEINKKGLGNNTNIFPKILNEFPIPNISIKEQKNIVSQIEKKIKKQDVIKEKIAVERKKIDEMLNKLLTQ